MKKLKTFPIVLIFLAIIISGTVGVFFLINGILNSNQTDLNYISRDNIVINSNSGADYFFRGTNTDGTELNPFKIKNYIIDANNSNSGIFIQDTDKYIVIENCIITRSGFSLTDAGIKLSNCTNVIIRNCTLESNKYGILVENSENIKMNLNYIAKTDFLYQAYGISVRDSNYCSLNNNTVLDVYSGIVLSDSNNNELINNIVMDNEIDIELVSCSNNILTGNSMRGGGFAAYNAPNNEADTSNTVNGKPLYFISNTNGLVLDGIAEVGQIMMASSSNCIISNLEVTGNFRGFYLFNCVNITLSGNNATGNDHGIMALDSTFINISGNYIWDNNVSGIHFASTMQSSISGNYMSNNLERGISFTSSDSNVITRNFFSNGYRDIILSSSDYVNVTGNKFAPNENGVIMIWGSKNGIIWLNEFQRTGVFHAYPFSTTYNWDNGTIGNYWADYIDLNPTASDIGGIWSLPYDIYEDAVGQDGFPLVNPPDLELLEDFP